MIKFGDAALELEAFAYVSTRDGEVFLEIQEELLLGIMDIIEASGTAFSLPSGATPVIKGLLPDARAQDATPQEKKRNGPRG